MSELTKRAAHSRSYWKDGAEAAVTVNENGVVECSEELFDVLLRIAGYHEVDPPENVDILPVSVLNPVSEPTIPPEIGLSATTADG